MLIFAEPVFAGGALDNILKNAANDAIDKLIKSDLEKTANDSFEKLIKKTTDEETSSQSDSVEKADSTFKKLMKTASYGNASAQSELGKMYYSGNGVIQNYKKAFEWHEKAALQGNCDSQYALGVMYYKGESISKNFEKAFEWYEKAALQDHTYSQYMLGMMYANGQGVPKSYNNALDWYGKADAKGYTNAKKQIIMLNELINQNQNIIAAAPQEEIDKTKKMQENNIVKNETQQNIAQAINMQQTSQDAHTAAQDVQQDQSTEIVATGIGADPDGSLKNALTSAVEQAVGLVVDAETIVKNESIVKDQILTFSDGYVEKYDKIKEGKRDDGLYETKIKATIKKRQLIEKLKQSDVSVKQVDGQSLFAEVYTMQASTKDVVPIIEKAFEGLPLSLLKVEVIDSKPKIIEQNKDTIKAQWFFKITIDFDVYYKNLVPKFEKIFGDIAIQKSQNSIITQARFPERAVQIENSNEFKVDFEQPRNIKFDKNKMIAFSLNVRKNKKNDNLGWNWYLMEDSKKEIQKLFDKIHNKYFDADNLPTLRVSFLNRDNQIIRENEIKFKNLSYYVEHAMFDECYGSANIYYLYPYFFNNGDIYNTFNINNTFEFTLEEIKDITQIKAALIENIY